jgi:FAD/FMN-containing dehydrogenase
MKTTDDLVKIASYGGGLVLDASRTTEDLVKIVSYAAGNGSRVVIKKAGSKTTDDLVKIASYGKGAVIFDLTE